LLLLVAGATINVAVAWGWAAWGVPPHGDLGMWSVSTEDSPFWLMQGHSGMGASVVRVAPIYAEGRHATPFQHLARSRPDVPAPVRERFTQGPTRDDRYTRHGFDERGWPLRCLRSEHTYHHASDRAAFIGDVQVVGGVPLWSAQTAKGGWALQRVRALPLLPIWPAFVVNTLLYAALTGVVCMSCPAMVRTLGVRKSVRLALVALLVAPLLVIAVAWLSAASHVGDQMERINAAETLPKGGESSSQVMMARQDRRGGTRLVFSAGRAGTDADRLPPPPILGAAPAWSWSAVEEARRREWGSFEWHTVEAVGWPWRALQSSFESRMTDTLAMEVDAKRGIVVGTLPAGLGLDTPRTLRLLPTRIIWPGFMADWAVYALMLFGVIALPSAARAGLRMRRGRCVGCGYDLRRELSAGCPECGWTRGGAEVRKEAHQR
jgi:hypothetical protein